MITAPSVKEISEGSRWWCGRWGGQGKHRSGRVFLRTWSGLTELTSQSTAKEACSDKFESNQEHKTELETSITLREIPKQLLLQFLDVNIGKIKKKKRHKPGTLCFWVILTWSNKQYVPQYSGTVIIFFPKHWNLKYVMSFPSFCPI